MRSNWLRNMVLLILVGVTSSIGAPRETSTLDTCKNVDFRVTNGLNVSIDIKQIKYFNQSENRWETENVKNGSERCNKGQVCEMTKEDIGGAENQRLTRIIFVYEKVGSNVTYESPAFVPQDPVCKGEKIFGYKQGWKIVPSTSTATSGAGACKAQFDYTNGRDTDISLTGIKYLMAGKWKTMKFGEFGNFFGTTRRIYDKCAPGQVCTKSDKESKVLSVPYDDTWYHIPDARGADITKIIFLYRYNISTVGNDWSKDIESRVFVPANPRCVDGTTYGHGQVWTIGG